MATQVLFTDTDSGRTALYILQDNLIDDVYPNILEVETARGAFPVLDDRLDDVDDTLAAIAAGSGVVISVDDTIVGYLEDKLLPGDNITLTVGSPGGNETLTVAVTGIIKDIVKTIKTADYTILTSDDGKQIALGLATTADKIFTLPSVGSSEDGLIIHLSNESNYKLTIQPSDNDSVWNSGNGYGIETKSLKAYCTLRYGHATTSWVPLQIGSGLWIIEGLKLWAKLDKITTLDPDNPSISSILRDEANRHRVRLNNGAILSSSAILPYPVTLSFGGTDETIDIGNSLDWGIFEDNTKDVTVFLRVRFDNSATGNEYIIGQYEDANNSWRLRRIATGELVLTYISASSTEINISSTGTLSAGTWYDLCICRVGDDVGLYIDGVQVGFDNIWTEDVLTGSLYLSESGAAAAYFIGRMNDALIAYQNIFNASPNVGLSDTITIPENFNFVTGAS